jgi:SAM-dependent methyltransferase
VFPANFSMGQSDPLSQVLCEGRGRLYPSITNPNWLVLRERRKLFVRWLAQVPVVPLSVLDVGGRIQPYRPLLEGRLRCYVAVDVRSTPLVDIVARGEQLPLRDDSFDLIICTQVLEYVEEPRTVIGEIHRVLKPGGFLLLSAPAIFPVDSEDDRWRFLPPGLYGLLASFRRVEVHAEGSSIEGLFRTVAVWIASFARPRFFNRLLRWTLIPVLNLVGSGIAAAVRSSNDQFAANFSALAVK